MWSAIHSRLFSLLKVIWIRGICTFFFFNSFLATSIHSGVGSCLQECSRSQSSTLIYDLIDKVSMGEVYNQFCTNFIFPSAVYGTLEHDKRQDHMFQVSIHLLQTNPEGQQKGQALRDSKDWSISLVFKQLQIQNEIWRLMISSCS